MFFGTLIVRNNQLIEIKELVRGGYIMDYIKFSLLLLSAIFIHIVVIGLFMKIANFIGEKLGIGRFVMYLIHKLQKIVKRPL
ncbi:hypothetical protein [Alkaliphilus serpentinus]|uniref:Uncharacterized protein n=1 Tax=Alkaliphilus serpentinus TaxID=1482731 RepID=A0A833HNJ1_9FIRM|nr:hypothetical protein [Alkaliphilus serpentinus]KAB3529416.1 hypothetical protein F8153_09290 [Alkaliphilus serpentinus]